MEIVARLKTFEEINIFSQLGVDVFCLDTCFTTKKIREFNLEEIKKIKLLNKKVYVLLNKMIHQEDLERLKTYLESLKDLNVDGIVINDLTVYVLAKKINLKNKIIYQPGTMNTDTFSVDYFSKKNIFGITISRELTLEEIKIIAKKNTKLNLSFIIHGYLDMFYSKRKLISSYLKYKKIEGNSLINNYDLRLNEEIRPNDLYPILEDKFGTHIFRSHKLISIDEFQKLNSVIDTFFIERLFINDDEYIDSIKLYKNKITKTEFLAKYKDFDSGFYYLRTEKIKGERL